MAEERERGLQALQAGDTAEAIRNLEGACAVDPADYQAHIYLGAAYSQANRTLDAIQILTRAVQLQPSNPQARYNLGIAMERGDYREQAVTAYEQAITLQPDYPKAQEGLARVRAGAPPPVNPASSRGPAPIPQGAVPQYGGAFAESEFAGPQPAGGSPVRTPLTGAPAQPASMLNVGYAPPGHIAAPAIQTQEFTGQGLSDYATAPSRSAPSTVQPGSIYGPAPMTSAAPVRPAPTPPAEAGATAFGAFLGVVLGGIAGIIGLILWVALTHFTHVRIGYAAIGVGALIGWMVKLGFRQGGPAPGIIAGAISLFSLGIGCLLTGFGGVSAVFSILFIVIGVSAAFRIASR